MFSEFGRVFEAVVLAVIGLAVVAVIVSQQSQAPTVISSTTSGLASLINAAVSPVAGGGYSGGWSPTSGYSGG